MIQVAAFVIVLAIATGSGSSLGIALLAASVLSFVPGVILLLIAMAAEKQ